LYSGYHDKRSRSSWIFHGKDKSHVKVIFNAIASRYDFMNTLMSFGLDYYWRKRTVQVVQAKPGMKNCRCLLWNRKADHGTCQQRCPLGPGRWYRLFGKDAGPSWKNLANARGKENVKLLQGDALNLSFEDNSFDGATIGWGDSETSLTCAGAFRNWCG
jgi:demethylmenaquinone methyltransferase/2-methoxy-6-polyprenyl-1,4-benzoquinol methylase